MKLKSIAKKIQLKYQMVLYRIKYLLHIKDTLKKLPSNSINNYAKMRKDKVKKRFFEYFIYKT